MKTALKIRNILLISFLLTYLVIVILLTISRCEGYYRFIKHFYLMDYMETMHFTLYILGSLAIFAITSLLIPAVAIHWEYAVKTKKE